MTTSGPGRRRRNRHGDAHSPEVRWMITFSDLCTLLLTFFVLILSMSSMNKLAFRSTFRNFDGSIADKFFKDKERIVTPRDAVIKEMIKSLEGVLELNAVEVDEAVERSTLDEDYSLVVTSGKAFWIWKDRMSSTFSLIFGEKLLFESGSADLSPAAVPLLETLGGFLTKSNYRAYIDGHTDSAPLAGDRFASNEDLSLARAQAVLSFFVTRCNVSPRRLAMGGYGSSHPLSDNRTAKGRAMNRRVEITFEG
ncbi:MAG: OmpA family protein [Deltaproteobacteria bacterium]|nr:OmpA family protein [Deltaproteobacteria bacterium]